VHRAKTQSFNQVRQCCKWHAHIFTHLTKTLSPLRTVSQNGKKSKLFTCFSWTVIPFLFSVCYFCKFVLVSSFGRHFAVAEHSNKKLTGTNWTELLLLLLVLVLVLVLLITQIKEERGSYEIISSDLALSGNTREWPLRETSLRATWEDKSGSDTCLWKRERANWACEWDMGTEDEWRASVSN
jgi:hypothetical protein